MQSPGRMGRHLHLRSRIRSSNRHDERFHCSKQCLRTVSLLVQGLLLIQVCLVLSLNIDLPDYMLPSSMSSFIRDQTIRTANTLSTTLSTLHIPIDDDDDDDDDDNNNDDDQLTPCGDWTPNGNLNNPRFNATHVQAMDDDQYPSCGHDRSQVGQIYEPSQPLYCNPPLRGGKRSLQQHREPAVLGLDLQLRPNAAPDYSIVSPSHNVQQVLQTTVPLLCRHTTGQWEVIFVLDQSYDDSLQTLRDILLSNECQRSSLIRARVLLTSTGIFETSADNLGMTLANPSSKFLVEIQADMLLGQTGWNTNMARPLLQYQDLFAISGRCGHAPPNTNTKYRFGRCGANVAQFDDNMQQQDRDVVHVCGTINRGPIIFRAEVLRRLGFLDEVNFHQGKDDHDIVRRALHQGWHVAYRYLHFYAPLHLSPMRDPKFNAKMPPSAIRQSDAYYDYRKMLRNNTCDPDIPFNAIAWDHLIEQPETRQLNPIPQGFDTSNLSLLESFLQPTS